uniref:Uncharacterized protein n=1 Tax=Clastoptera arizonana TaxID=38151 RepID=A0A1B6DIM7_9HEMI
MAEDKIFTSEEIQKVNPRYRGKPENFKPAFKRDNKPRSNPKSQLGPKSPSVPKPTQLDRANVAPTPPKNESLFSDAIFGPDVIITEINARQDYSSNFAKIIDIADAAFAEYVPDEVHLDRKLERVEFRYYACALMWLRLIDIKAKQTNQALTREEKDLRKVTEHDVFNLPRPLYVYLAAIGQHKDKMGKLTELEIPPLPITVAGGKGGYHANAVNENTHNLFEEVPTLGVLADIIMSIATANPGVPVIPIELPENTELTTNFIGYLPQQAPSRPEVVRRLNGLGIMPQAFPEYTANTRFNIKYIRSLSDLLGQIPTFKVEKVSIPSLNLIGSATMVIETKPVIIDEVQSWTNRSVETTSAADETSGAMGSAYMCGFQLYKEDGANGNHDIWSCIRGVGEHPWMMPQPWYNNRNDRRNLPPGIGTMRFRGIVERQDLMLENIIRRLIMTKR